jgi:fibronectin-binding autotransporter adhesin
MTLPTGLRRLLPVVAVALAASGAALAQNGTWTGATNGNWSVAGNWMGNTPPTNGGSVTFNASSTGTLATTNDAAAGINSLSGIVVGAVPNASSILIGGQGFSLGAGGIDLTGAPLTQSLSIGLDVNQSITLTATQSWKLSNTLVANGTSTQNLTISTPILGAVGADLTYGVTNSNVGSSTSGTIQLGAANTYAGNTTLGGPNTTYVLGTSSPFGTGTVTQNSFNTAPRYQTNGNIHIANAMQWGSGFRYETASTGSLTFDGPITFVPGTGSNGGNRTINNISNQLIVINGSVTQTDVAQTAVRNFLLNANPGGIVVNGSILSTSTFADTVLKQGTGTATINSTNNTYFGQTQIQNGVLEVVSLADLSTQSSLGAPTTAANGTITLGVNATAQIGTLRYIGAGSSTNRQVGLPGTLAGSGGVLDASGTGPVNFTSATMGALGATAKTLTFTGSNAGLNSFAGLIANPASTTTTVSKTGPGTWALTNGGSTYSGGTSISGGTLLVNNTSGTAGLGAAAVAVTGTSPLGSGGTLGGTGSISSVVTVSTFPASGTSGGAVAPGTVTAGGAPVAGTLTTSANMIWNPVGRFVFLHDANNNTVGSGVNGLLTGTGTAALDLENVTASAQFDINLKPLTFVAGTPGPTSYTIATFAGGILGKGNTATRFDDQTILSAGGVNLFSFSGSMFPGSPAPTAVVVGQAGGQQSIVLTFTPVPEPTFIVAACAGLTGLAVRLRRRKPLAA